MNHSNNPGPDDRLADLDEGLEGDAISRPGTIPGPCGPVEPGLPAGQPAGVLPAFSRVVDSQARHAASYPRLGKREQQLAAAQEEAVAAEDQLDEAREGLVRSVLAAVPVEVPEDYEWVATMKPLASYRTDGRTFHLVKTAGANIPNSLDQLAQGVQVVIVDDRDTPPGPPAGLTQDQKSILFVHESLGHRESIERLGLHGAYQVIYDAVMRLGLDAVNELRAIIARGSVAPVEGEGVTS